VGKAQWSGKPHKLLTYVQLVAPLPNRKGNIMNNIIRKHKQLLDAMYIAQPETCLWFSADNIGRPEGTSG